VSDDAPAEEDLPEHPPAFPPFELTGSERLYDSIWCGLRRDDLLLPDGTPSDHHVFEVVDAVVVVPVLTSGELLLIGQHRHAHGLTRWEVPAGRMSAGETPRETAERELLEESGCTAGRWVELPGFYPLGGISAHWVHAFVALDCERVADQQLDPTERILPRAFPRADVVRLLRAGRIVDAFTALALHYYLDQVADREGPGA
jgi:ADP-ribose pyrophosphatase